MGILKFNDSCYKLQQLSLIKSHERINDFILYIDGPLLMFRGIANNCFDLYNKDMTLDTIKNNILRKVVAIVNNLKSYGNCIQIKIYYDGQAPYMKKLTQQKRNKDVFPMNLTYKEINNHVQEHIIGDLRDKLHLNIEIINLEVGEAENEMYRKRDTNYTSVMFTKDTDVFVISYNHQPKSSTDIVYMYDGEVIYNMNRFTCGLNSFQFRTLVSLSGTDFNCTIFTPTMIKAILEVFLLKQINNNKNLFKQLLYFNNYKENLENTKINDLNNNLKNNKENTSDKDSTNLDDQKKLDNINCNNIECNNMELTKLSKTNQYEFNDYEMYQRLLKNNIMSPSDIIKNNIIETNKYVNSKSDKKIFDNYNEDTKQKIMNNLDLDVIIHRILENNTDIEALICDFLLIIYHLKQLNYKNIRLPQKEIDNYHYIVIDNNAVLNNFIINLDWVVNYFNLGADYEEFNLNFKRYEYINKLSFLHYIFLKRFDRNSVEYRKLFNLSVFNPSHGNSSSSNNNNNNNSSNNSTNYKNTKNNFKFDDYNFSTKKIKIY